MKRLTIVTLLATILISSFVPVTVAADQLSEAKDQKSSIDSRINKLNQQKKQVMQQKSKLESQKSTIAKQQKNESNAYQELLKQISDAEENLRQTEKALKEAEDNYNNQRELVKTRLQVMYMNSSVSVLDTLLTSKSPLEFFERAQYMSTISQFDETMIEELNNAKQDVEDKKQLEQQARDLLAQKADEKEQRLSQLKSSRADVEDQIERSKSALDKLERDIDAQIAEANRLNSIIKKLSSKGKYAGGSMVWPCPGNYDVTSRYGMRKHPILRKYKMHTGIDIGADRGDSIVAANSGTVIMAQYDRSGGYGNMVVIDHGGGITTLYAHASKLLVSVGQHVKSGQVIAKVGSTGLSTGNHLHFEVRVNGETKNPQVGYLKN
ncbi:MAG TPA: peptidoglycan DD-metalloendopeptidase family protein [Clostridia bacterium]|nr:peptidoglycan DD-metalloendopeptidase family protein [Clostridia bacterium]